MESIQAVINEVKSKWVACDAKKQQDLTINSFKFS